MVPPGLGWCRVTDPGLPPAAAQPHCTAHPLQPRLLLVWFLLVIEGTGSVAVEEGPLSLLCAAFRVGHRAGCTNRLQRSLGSFVYLHGIHCDVLQYSSVSAS